MSLRMPMSLAVAAMLLTMAGCQDDARAGAAEAALEILPLEELSNPFPTMIRPWGTLPDGRDWGQVSALDIDRDGIHVWAADRCGSTACVGSDLPVVMRLDPDGNVLTSFGAGMFIRPHGVFVDRDNNIWVTDHQNARPAQLEEFPEAAGKGQQVFKFSPQGEILLALGTAGEPGDPPTHLNNPTAVIVAPNGDIFVAEGHSNQNPPGRISKFASDGTFLMSWGQFGEGPGEFRTPHGLAFDSQGRLFVADRGNNRIQVFDQEGNLLEELRQFGRPNDVHIDANDVLYAIDSESSEDTNPGFSRGIYIGNARTGERVGFIPPHPTDSGLGTHGEGIALDRAGNLYVAEVSIRGLTKYTRP